MGQSNNGSPFNGLCMGLGSLPLLSNAVTRSISAENPTGQKGMGAMSSEGTGAYNARDLGVGWKVSPSIFIEPGEEHVLGFIEGSGAIQSMWFGGCISRDWIIRIYWDGLEHPSVECPLTDFFATGWTNNENGRHVAGPFFQLNSLPVSINPNNSLNCFWEMPFKKSAKITFENIAPARRVVYYQINYTLTEVPDNAAYFHAQFRQAKHLPYKEVFTIADGIKGKGHYVGTALSVGLNSAGNWWGEGEIKFYIDGDEEYPTICGTGTEDYFGGSYDWEVDGEYVTYTTPFMGMYAVRQPNRLYNIQQRFSMYRWHIMDPIRFDQDLRITLQDLGWRNDGRYLPRRDDFASVAYWYQELPAAPFPKLPDRDELTII
jgi:hypothetical protein